MVSSTVVLLGLLVVVRGCSFWCPEGCDYNPGTRVEYAVRTVACQVGKAVTVPLAVFTSCNTNYQDPVVTTPATCSAVGRLGTSDFQLRCRAAGPCTTKQAVTWLTNECICDKSCKTTCGKIIADGWSGKDDGPNHCNMCWCRNGKKICTLIGCSPKKCPPDCSAVLCPVLKCPFGSYIPEGQCCPRCLPVNCALVLCRAVVCQFGSYTPPGECCPRCLPRPILISP
eukprot:Sspe_Gene.82581::Locus_54118_Transcript_1_2_Confidence_0.400_Length_1106::g.82581::m.82581